MKQLKDLYSDKYKKNESLSFHEYLSENSEQKELKRADALKAADTKRRFGDDNYGNAASMLNDIGLSLSGYADYITASARDRYAGEKGKSELDYKLGEAKEIAGYEKYISDYDALQSKISNSVIESLINDQEFNLEAAYKKALDAGLSKRRAFESATAGVKGAKEKVYDSAVLFAKLNSLSPKRAKDYATSLGLEEKDAERVYQAILEFGRADKEFLSTLTPDGYYQYVVSQSNKQ